MLLFLLSFYLHYDLLSCEENFKAKFNEASIANYHRQIRAQLNTLLLEMEEKSRKQNNVKRQEYIYKNSSVLRSLISVKDRNHQNLRKSTAPSPVFLLSLQYDPVPPSAIPSIARESQHPGHQLIPMNSIYHGLKNDSSHYLANHSSLRSIFGAEDQNLHKAPPFLDQLRKLPFSYSTLRHMYATKIPLQAQPLRPLNLYVSQSMEHPLQDSTMITKTIRKTTTKGENAKAWFQVIGPYTPRKKKKTKAYTETTEPQRTTSTPRRTTPTPQRTTATTKYWSITGTANTAQLIYTDKNEKDEKEPGPMQEDPNENETTPITGEKTKAYTETTEPQRTTSTPRRTTPTPQRTTATTKYWSITETANTAQLIYTDEDEKDEEGPGTTQVDPNENETTTIAGDVLYGKIKVQQPSTTQALQQHHLELMEQLEEGYMMVFFLEMFRLVAVKNKREVQQVLSPMGPIYKTLSDRGGLAWVGDPLQIFIEKLSGVASGGVTVEVLRTYSSMMFHTLVKRKQVLSPEVNSIIDQAEMLYSDEDGKRLLRTLSQFEDYPNNSKDSYLICESLVDNIIEPFRRPAIARSRQRLLDSVNRALRRRFPLLARKRVSPEVGTNLEERNIFTARPKFGINPSESKFIVTKRPKVGTNPSKRRRRRHHKKKRKRQSVLKPEFYKKQMYTRH